MQGIFARTKIRILLEILAAEIRPFVVVVFEVRFKFDSLGMFVVGGTKLYPDATLRIRKHDFVLQLIASIYKGIVVDIFDTAD